MVWFKIRSFIAFLLASTNKHGVHSPFVYDLVTECFNTQTNPAKMGAFNRIQKSLFSNKNSITITDYGKGSSVFKSNDRKVSDIAKIAGINKKKSALLLRMVAYLNPKNILEIGTSVGLGTSVLSIGNPDAKIVTLEGCKNTADVATALFKTNQLNNIDLIVGNFNETLSAVLADKQYDLIYFDGNHQNEPTLQYFNQCLETVHNNSIFIFDDINWSPEMQLAWQEIKNHPKVTISINTFFWGMVFFRKEQKKQHFTIRV
ncbi:MAG TPA: class I SAM-dependent methyltransferase [Lutibacter sp.]|nr:class I SAM-dependent methyltransferase [Lutibacter sp.]